MLVSGLETWAAADGYRMRGQRLQRYAFVFIKTRPVIEHAPPEWSVTIEGRWRRRLLKQTQQLLRGSYELVESTQGRHIDAAAVPRRYIQARFRRRRR